MLAILTGYTLSLLQLSTYIYSLVVLVALVYLIPHVRKQSPFESLALAWLYALDTIINAAYTVAFGVHWYATSTGTVEGGSEAPSNESRVEKFVRGGVVAPEDTAMSIIFIVGATIIRIYFTFVVMSFARQVIQRYMHLLVLDAHVLDDQNGPFAPNLPDGEGRRGRLGRYMVSFGRRYWLAVSEEEAWSDNGHSRKTSSSGTLAGEV